MEERKSWLPAGLEGSGWEPDDRASQRSGAASRQAGSTEGAASSAQPKAEKPAASAGPSASSGPWQPYDPDRPESKRSGTSPDSESAKGGSPEPQPETKKRDAPEAKDEEPTREQRDDDGKADDDRAGTPERDRERDEQEGGRSDVDAMGQDKHRTVIGQQYGASRTKQLAYYGTFVAFVIVAYFGLKIAVDRLDKAPARDRDQAPWSQKNAPDAPLGGFTPRTKGEKGPTNFQ